MNDERPIEKLLRRAAQKRNAAAGPPPELHPANRRMLQAEVAKQFPPPPAPAPAASSFWLGLSQRWALAVGVFIVLAVGALALWPALTKNKSAPQLSKLAPAADAAGLTEEKLTLTTAPPPEVQPMFAVDATTPSGGGNILVSPAPTSQPAPGPAEYFHRDTAPTTAARSVVPQTAGTRGGETSRSVNGLDGVGAERESTTRHDESRRAEPAPTLAPARSLAPAPVETQSSGTASRFAARDARPDPQLQLRGPGRDADDSALELEAAQAPVAPAALASGGAVAPATVILTDSESAAPPALRSEGAVAIASDVSRQVGLARGGGEERVLVVANSQMFSNLGQMVVAPPKKEVATSEPVPVLLNFKIEQSGPHVRVIDGDGSVYRGFVDEENTFYKQVVAQKEQTLAYDNRSRLQSPRAASATQAPRPVPGELYFYRVEGTNRSLNQNVVFSWNFTPTNEAVATAQQQFKDNLLKSEGPQTPPEFPDLLLNSIVNGRAQLGTGLEIEVNAVPVSR